MVHGSCWRQTLLVSEPLGSPALAGLQLVWGQNHTKVMQVMPLLAPGHGKCHSGTDVGEMGKEGKMEYGNFILPVGVCFSLVWYGHGCTSAHIHVGVGFVCSTVDKHLSLSLHSSGEVCWSNSTANAGVAVGAQWGPVLCQSENMWLPEVMGWTTASSSRAQVKNWFT